MCFKKKVTDKPIPKLNYIPCDLLKTELDLLGIDLLFIPMDGGQYVYADAESWAEIFSYIYCNYDMPRYIVDRMDCEDFAILMKGLVSSMFGVNSFAFAMGNVPGGYHAFNLFRTESGWLILEPQTGEFFTIGEKGYKPDRALI